MNTSSSNQNPIPESAKAYRASLLHFLSDPDVDGDAAYEYHHDGILVVNQGKVLAMGPADELSKLLPSTVNIIDYSGKLIMPGMIDTHIHYPQVEIIASYGEQLLDWLNNYTFPAEKRFEDQTHAEFIARFFINELLKCGTTTALVFGTVHKQSVDAFFNVSKELNTRMICGKVMMDRNAPDYLCDTPQSSYDDSEALINTWHQQGRQHYAVTPRFAITSTQEQLELAGALYQSHDALYMQTHISENRDEVAFVSSLFPDCQDYLDVYDKVQLLGPRSTFAHGIHLEQRELDRLKETQSQISFCPTSNLFLGSGLLNIAALEAQQIPYSIATDVGGGTSFSMLQTLNEAYKVCQLREHSLSPFKSLYMATLGNAKSLQLDDKIGNFSVGNDADFIVIDCAATPLMALRQRNADSLAEQLFALIILGDDRAIHATYVAGKQHQDLNVIDPNINSKPGA